MSAGISAGETISIIGAGVIGLAVAAAISGGKSKVYILERNDGFGKETSSRSSETIHAGIYYPAGSLKAETCVAGNRMLYQICEKNGVGCRKTGKLIVAVNDDEVGRLEELLERGKANGVRDLEMLPRRKIQEMEPNIKAVAAISSPSSGVIDSYALMRYFLSRAMEQGAKIVYKSEVAGLEKSSQGYELTVNDSSGTFSFQAGIVINCAGLQAHRIAQLAGIDIGRAGYRIHYCKGDYFSVGNNKNRLVSRLVYPVPDYSTGGTGIHNTLDIDGRMRLGPDAHYVNQIDYSVDVSKREFFLRSVTKFLPFIEYDDLEPETAGIRPKLQGPGEGFRDFIVRHEDDRGLPGLVNLIGIESPGLTGAPAIAELVQTLIKGLL